ncbi:MAG: hypothetical protein MZV70_57875 [Desulfobacterales bacterium]|nr:hypothetical protein [Desulfobacterales bacterium]
MQTHGPNELKERRGKGPLAHALGAVHRDHGADPDRRRRDLGLPGQGHRNRGHPRHRGALRRPGLRPGIPRRARHGGLAAAGRAGGPRAPRRGRARDARPRAGRRATSSCWKRATRCRRTCACWKPPSCGSRKRR